MRQPEFPRYAIIAAGLLLGCMTALGAHGLLVA